MKTIEKGRVDGDDEPTFDESRRYNDRQCCESMMDGGSASAVERDMQFCFLEDQLTKDLPINWQAPEVDFLSS